MSRPLTRQEALRILELPATADGVAVKRAYRRLARDHHPDLGGDPHTFHRLQLAFERLVDEPPGSGPPPVSRGRPSRAHPVGARDAGPVDLERVDWATPAPGDGAALDRHRLAVLLARDHPGPVHPVVAASRAPGSRLNRMAAMLAADLISWLTVRPDRDDRGHTVVALELLAPNRKARRVVDRVGLDGAWTRTRGSSTTTLRSTVQPAGDRRASSVQATQRVEALLDALAWPLTAWTVTVDRERA